MTNYYGFTRRSFMIILLLFFCFKFLAGCTGKEEARQASDECNLTDNTCCECTATYVQLGQVANVSTVCTPAAKQDFMNTWTNPLVSIVCKKK